MTPKEQAKELFMDMKYHIPYVHDPTEPSEDKIAKQCALIAIDKLIIEENRYNNGSFYPSRYWQLVKQEIEKL